MTLFTVTIHPRMYLAVLLSHVQSFRSLGGSRDKKREKQK